MIFFLQLPLSLLNSKLVAIFNNNNDLLADQIKLILKINIKSLVILLNL